jgi:ankyrin repeat protein
MLGGINFSGDRKNETKIQTLHYAIAKGEMKDVLRMIHHYNFRKILSLTDSNGSNALHIATRRGDVAMVETILNFHEIDVNSQEKRNVGGYSALHLSCKLGLCDVVYTLLQHDAEINQSSNSTLAECPLHLCCKYGKLDCAEALVRSGCNIHAKDAFGNNASYWARLNNYNELILLLSLPPPHTATVEEHISNLFTKYPAMKESFIPASPKKSSRYDRSRP